MSSRGLLKWGVIIVALLALIPGGVQASASRDIPIDAYVPNRKRVVVTRMPVEPTQAAQSLSTAPAGSGPVHHKIQPGDTLFQLSVRYGIGVDAITKANGITENSILREGMDLVLPYVNEVGSATMGPNGPVVRGKGLHFVASNGQQKCWLFKDGAIVDTWPCSTGRKESKSALGNYTVQSKLDRGYSYAADAWMPYWLGIYDAPGGTENGIHGIPYRASTGEQSWLNEVGSPVTFGCVMLSLDAAKKVYNLAYIGMPVTLLP
jgi:lipoprotein-anchoring transpeptidase ErfK/SrfK